MTPNAITSGNATAMGEGPNKEDQPCQCANPKETPLVSRGSKCCDQVGDYPTN